MTMRLSPDFSAFVAACAEHDVRVIGVEDPVANTRASGRLQDLADVERLLGGEA